MNTQNPEFEGDPEFENDITPPAQNDASDLDSISEAEPDESLELLGNQPQKPVLTNGVRTQGSKRITPVDPEVILAGIQDQTDGWPKCVAGGLIVKSATGKLEVKSKDAELFAWLHLHFDIDWYGSPGISKKEFFEFCRLNSERYRDATDYPHFPPIDDVLYEHEPLPSGSGQALIGLLQFFTPATPSDRELIKALLLTLFWGGPPGQRPGFLITTTDTSVNQGRGWGKTTLLEICAELSGGVISTSQSGCIEGLKKRILTQADHEPRPRVIAIDNVKTRRFSSADLEALITARQISGHVMYRGNGSVPNFHTVGITINGASLSKDMAQRCIVIKLGTPVYTQTWQRDLETYVDTHRWEIIADIGQLLTSDGQKVPGRGNGPTGRLGTGRSIQVEQPNLTPPAH